MFRPNRIGTPSFFKASTQASTANQKLAETTKQDILWNASVVNASPALDLGRTSLTHWGGSTAFTMGYKGCVAQQFTVTEPLAGNAVGLELTGSFTCLIPASCMVVPYMAKAASAAGSLLAQITASSAPTVLGEALNGVEGDEDFIWRSHHYKTQAVIQDDVIAGTYFHGFAFFFAPGTPIWYGGHLDFAVRQLNDQEDIGYRDTRR